MQDVSVDWSGFHRAALSRPPRELLRRTLGCFEIEKRAPGVAVDLGCGSGPDTVELLRRGWKVHAVDASPAGLELLSTSIPTALGEQLICHVRRFEEFEFPTCDLIWAGYSLPFCEAAHWKSLWQRAISALRCGGRIAGDLFGCDHAFAQEGGVLVFTETEARSLLSELQLEAFDIEDGYRPSGGEITRWHAFGFAARVLTECDA